MALEIKIGMDVHITLGPSARENPKSQNATAIDNVYRRLDFADSEIHLESAPINHSSSPYDFIYKGIPEEDARRLAHEINNQIEDIYAKAVRRK